MITIDGHTFDETLLTGGWVIDAGCRGFKFADYHHHETDVYALDIENFNGSAMKHCSKFINAALTDHSGETEAYFFGNGTANFLKGINEVPENSTERPCETKKVKCITLQDIYSETGTNIDLLKMDIEGSEYEVMLNMEPIPKQISVEFHEHTVKNLHDQYIDRILDHLCKYYNITLHIREWPRYKFMDCLFIRKNLL